MATKFKRIGVLTSGGDAPGMNAAVRAVTRAALAKGVAVTAIYEGYQGLMDHDEAGLKQVSQHDVSNIISLGGTVLYSARAKDFKTEEGMARAIEGCRQEGIDGIIAIGGDGTFRGATDLSQRGIPCIGIPATIDNDITSTDHSIGFDTAVNTLLGVIDRMRDTCESHARCDVIEVMGRNAGYIALEAGIASGAIGIATLEAGFDEQKLFDDIKTARAMGKRNFIILVAEGVQFAKKDQGIENYSEKLTEEIEKTTGIECRFCRPAHMLRGGNPTARDRVLASRLGYEAVELLLDGKSDMVVCEQNDQITSVDINYALILDRMYKGKLKDGDLDKFTPEQVESMKAFCAEKSRQFKELYNIAQSISVYSK